MVAVATPRRTAQALGKWRPSLTPAGPQKIADSSGAKKQHQERAPRQQQDPTPCHKATACRDSAQDGCKGSLHPASRAADASFSKLTTNHSGLGRELQKTAAQDSPKLQPGSAPPFVPALLPRAGSFQSSRNTVEHQLRS